MSASTSDQRMKGQGNQPNGPKDSVNEQEDFDSWRNQPHQDYGVDQYISSYYGAAYPHESFSAGAWSNTGAPSGEGVAFLGGSFGNFGQQGYNTSGYGYPGNASGGEYSTWGRKPVYDEYYSSSGNRLEDQGSKTLEQGMHGLSLNRESRKPGAQPELGASSQPKKLTWASIASQPAKPQLTNKKKSMVPPPMIVPRISSLDIGTWESKNGAGAAAVSTVVPPPSVPVSGVAKPTGPPPVLRQTGFSSPPRAVAPQRSPSSALPPMGSLPPTAYPPPPAPAILPPPMIANLPPPPAPVVPEETSAADPVLEELHLKHEYNPKDFDLSAKNARFFVIKSYSEDDIHRSIKYEIWCSTEHGNKRLDAAFRERDGKGPVYLFFSVNGSGHFCGMAEMISPVDMSATLSVWSQDKWRGQFTVKWIYVKDVPNSALRHIRLENNENKPVTNSRDTQEVLPEKGRLVLRILHNYRHATSIFDDFTHYEKRQAEEDQRRSTVPAQQAESPYDDEIPKTRDRPELQDRDRDQGRGREPYRPPDRDRDQGRDREAYRPPDRERDRDQGRDREMYRVPDRDRDQGRDRESYRMYDRDRDHGRSQEGYRGPDRDRDQGRGRGSYDYRDRDNRNSRDSYRGGRGGRGSRH